MLLVELTWSSSRSEQLAFALDGHNGLWLCENHHKLFDRETIFLSSSGAIKYKSSLIENDVEFLQKITTVRRIPDDILHPSFVDFLSKRNAGVDEQAYLDFTG